jgi:3-oxoacyl-[acyl-carrier-protein] synthase-1
MISVYAGYDNIISPLGVTTGENIARILAGDGAIVSERFRDIPVSVARIDWQRVDGLCESIGVCDPYTELERLFIMSIGDLLKRTSLDPSSDRVAFVYATTKGNINRLGMIHGGEIRLRLWEMARAVNGYFKNTNEPVVVCNACVSGVSAILIARDLIEGGAYDTVVVCGGDLVSDFVTSGFCAFRAVSPVPCAPFDVGRKGLSLGEACGSMMLTRETSLLPDTSKVRLAGGATSNDANHISGPSRDGSGLYLALERAMREARVSARDIGSISAHGTGTPYNDDMESRAFCLAELDSTPLYSLKGFWGHTLGAAGLIESVIAVHAMRDGVIPGSPGYSVSGVPVKLNISNRIRNVDTDVCLKSASGFGGTNAAAVFVKE